MVVRRPRERKGRKPLVRFLENLVLGDTSIIGALYRWMYDRISLDQLMRDSGFTDIRYCDEISSLIEGYTTFHLDTCSDGSTYKSDSVYAECCRPVCSGYR
jgi:hypothetical protein